MNYRWRTEKFYAENGGCRCGYHAAEVWARDNRQCTECGTKVKKNLIIHHIIPYNRHDKRTTMLENLVVLCRKCHSRIHDQGKLIPRMQPPKRETLDRINFRVVAQEYIKEYEARMNG